MIAKFQNFPWQHDKTMFYMCYYVDQLAFLGPFWVAKMEAENHHTRPPLPSHSVVEIRKFQIWMSK